MSKLTSVSRVVTHLAHNLASVSELILWHGYPLNAVREQSDIDSKISNPPSTEQERAKCVPPVHD